MSSKEITSDHVEEFTEYLLQIFGMKVDPKTGEIRHADNEPVLIDTPNGPKPMMAYRELTKLKEHRLLNIFNDTDPRPPQLNWFYKQKRNELSILLADIMESAIGYKPGTINDEHEYVRLSITSLCAGDNKMLTAFKKITDNPEEIGKLITIFYKKQSSQKPELTKTAQLQTMLFNEEWRGTYSFPKKYWASWEKCFKHIFKIDDEKEFDSIYRFTSVLNSIPECEGFLRMYHRALQVLEKYYVAFHPEVGSFNLEMFDKHLPNIQKYYSLTDWVRTPSGTTAAMVQNTLSKPTNPLDPRTSTTPNQISLIPNASPRKVRSPLDPDPVRTGSFPSSGRVMSPFDANRISLGGRGGYLPPPRSPFLGR